MADESKTATWHVEPWGKGICKCTDGTHLRLMDVVARDAGPSRDAIIADHNQARRVPGLVKALACIKTDTFRLPGEDFDRVSHWPGLLPKYTRGHAVGDDCPLCAALIDTEVPNVINDA